MDLFGKRAELVGELGLLAEEGNKSGWESCRQELREVEDQIFHLTGLRPPYGTGWGTIFAETGYLGERED